MVTTERRPVAKPRTTIANTRAIFSFVACPETSMIASTRIARFLADKMRAPLIWDQTIGDLKVDVLVIVNGAYAFCKHLEPLSRAILAARRIVWIQNDYTIVPPICDGDAKSPFRAAFVERRQRGLPHLDYWTTCDKFASATKASALINWNALSYEEIPDRLVDKWRRRPSTHLLYYGSHRAGRASYFDRYFADPKVDVLVSSPSKKFEKYVGPRFSLVRQFDEKLIEQIGARAAGLYLEDRKSHSEYHSPPNRFYEMLSAGLPIIFQPECGATLRRAGYDPEPYLAGTNLALSRLFARREEIGRQQRADWLPRAREEHRRLTLDAVGLAWEKLKETMT